jgi:hypothetical protein
MKFSKCLRNILITLTVLSVISFSESRRSSSKTRSRDVTKPVTEYEVKLQIQQANIKLEHNIQIDMESFNQQNYGIQFSLKSGTINNAAFFLVSPNVYHFNFKNTNGINCLNQANFSHDTMHFMVHVNNQDYQINFVFPNGWAFGASVDILSLCNKFRDRWTEHQSKTEQLKQDIMSLYAHITLEETKRANNIKSKTELKGFNEQLSAVLSSVQASVKVTQADIEVVSKQISEIGLKEATESDNLKKLIENIEAEQTKMAIAQAFIDSNNKDSSNIKVIQQSEITNIWNSFKNELDALIGIHSDEDILKQELRDLSSNVVQNSALIMKKLDF